MRKTGEDLLRALQALSPEDLKKIVRLEGCDCYGDFNGQIEVRAGNKNSSNFDCLTIGRDQDS